MALTIFSCAANVYQVYRVEKHIETAHETDLKPVLIIPLNGIELTTITPSKTATHKGTGLLPLRFIRNC